MLLIRRLWLLPAACLTFLVYYLFLRAHESPSRSSYPANSNDGLLYWTKRPERYPVSVKQPPRGAANKLPAIQANFKKFPEAVEAKKKRETRQAAVKEAFLHSWNGYKAHAWTKDELSPISGSWRSSFGGWGATLVDTMDTLWIMDLKEDFAQCVEAVRGIDFTTNTEEVLNVFETTIRYMGGLIAAYDLSDKKYKILLTKAQELGEILYTAFDTPNRMPMTRWHWRKAALGNNDIEASTSTLLAELGSLSLEFTRLTQLTGDPKYYDAIRRVADEMEKLQNTTKIPGLWPTIIDASRLTADYNHFTFGGMADSTYEYLPKQHILIGARTSQYKHMYLKALEAAKQYLFFRPLVPDNRNILFSGNTAVNDDGTHSHQAQGQHLGCFVAGMVGMGARIFWDQDDLDIAQRLVDGCIWAYETMPTGLMPETFHMLACHVGVDDPKSKECEWDEDKYYTAISEVQGQDEASQSMSTIEKGKYWAKLREIAPGMTVMGDNRYILRPEAIESVFIMYRITGNPKLMDAAWKMFQDIDKWTRTEFAHAALNDVRHIPPEKSDRMESFWLAETLKYFYLIFSDPGLISLDEYVLNTEAHPFKRPTGIPVWGGAMKGTIG